MNLVPLCEMEMHCTWLDFVDYGVGGQYVGTLEGTVKGERLRGTLKSVNVPAKRPDNVNCPTRTLQPTRQSFGPSPARMS